VAFKAVCNAALDLLDFFAVEAICCAGGCLVASLIVLDELVVRRSTCSLVDGRSLFAF